MYKVSKLFSAGDERIELPPKVLETPIIPFDQSPIMLPNINYYIRNIFFCQEIFTNNLIYNLKCLNTIDRHFYLQGLSKDL